MKKQTLLLCAALMALLTSTFSYAHNHGSTPKSVTVRVISLPTNRMVVTTQMVSTEAVTIELLDETGRPLHFQKVRKQPAFAQSYNLSRLPDGKYLVRVSNADYHYTIPVQVTKGVAEVKKNEAEEIQRPQVQVANGKVDVWSRVPVSSSVAVKIFDAQQNLLFSEVATVENGIFSQRYNLSDLEQGAYVLTLTTREQTFTEELQLTR
ncbi:hypothetical protein GCM10027275_28070 [Rhabdobacter roseus]|uniref:T9SS type A sorting domain-containing protein n=1 Tax=Rhabdobacter roseus TaxID=1655419 RepID=A0A840TPA9_9BACT|nr:T9SS type A sorting domain-containing protein [Rhabdobacter roseus]MBB5284755.1 hypothetical protein [Rhabdobacter roseus]